MITKKSMQNLNALIFLAAVAECKSKRKASEVLHTSIDTVNKYLINLEHSLGMQLLINDTRGSRLTPQAITFIDRLKEIEKMLEFINKYNVDNEGYKGDVSICLSLNVGINFPKCYTADFYNKFPDIKIISTATSESPPYEDMGVDIAVITKEPSPSHKFTLLCKKSMKCGLFASKEYLSKYGYPKDIKDLQNNHKLVHVYNGYDGLCKMDKVVEEANAIRFVTNSGFCITSLIKNGVGVGVLPLHYKNKGFVLLDNINELYSEMQYYILVNNTTKEFPKVKAVAEHYCNALEQP